VALVPWLDCCTGRKPPIQSPFTVSGNGSIVKLRLCYTGHAMRTLDIKYYALLDALAEQGSVKAAAASLSLTQPAVSYRMREMERRLAVSLFDRRGHHISLTPAAHRLLTTAREVIPKLVVAEKDAVALAKSSVPAIKWGVDAHDTFTQLICHELDLMQKALDVCRVTNGELTQYLLEGGVDLAILNEPPLQRGIENTLLFTDHLVAVIPAQSPLAKQPAVMPEQMAVEPYITYSSRRKAGYEFDLFFHPAEQSPKTIKIVESVSLILELIAQTQQGVTILSSWQAATRVDDKRLVVQPLNNVVIPVSWYLSCQSSVVNEEVVHRLAALLKQTSTLSSLD